MRTLQCGACGGKLFSILKPGDEVNHNYVQLIAECQSCKSGTIIEPTPVTLELNWYKDSEGILSDFGR